MSSGRGRLRSSQRVARSTRRRASSSISICAARVDLEVERLDVGPQSPHVEDVAGDCVRARDVRRARARVLLQAEHEGAAGAVDDPVGHPRGDDLAPQPVPLEPVGEALRQRRGEVIGELRRQGRVLRQVGVEQFRVEGDLAVGEQHGELRLRQAGVRSSAFGDLLALRKRLELAVEPPGLLERAHHAIVDVEHPGRLREREAERLGLQVAAAQHPLGDGVGHVGEQPVALLAGQVAVGDDRVEQDLDVDLVVGAVDAAGVVDRIGVDPAAAERVLHAAALREAEVASLPHHAGAQLAGVDADVVVGLVADVGVVLGRRP